MKATSKEHFVPRFLTEKESLERLKKNRPDLYESLKKPSPKACLGANVMTLRRKKGLSQKDLADKAKVGFRTLQRLEEAQPNSNPTIDVVEGVATALGVNIQELFKPVDLTNLLAH
jgi:ribosome-binding protein aMBF1 (putative translation factor)